MRRPTLLCAGLTLLLACRDGGSRADDPETAVRAFFAAVAAGACDRIRSELIVERMTAEECSLMLEDFRERDARFVDVLEVRPDGRDDTVALVDIRIDFRGSRSDQHRWVVRARNGERGWRVHAPR